MLFKVFVLLSFLVVAQIVNVENTVIKVKSISVKLIPIKPLDLLDDAKALLDELGQVVLGNILAAHDKLDDLRLDVTSHRINVRLNAEIDVEQQHQMNDQELANLKELALGEEVDIDACLNRNEPLLTSLPDVYLAQIVDCIATTDQETEQILDDARYNTDVVINQVASFNFALGQCATNDERCISAIIDEINAAMEALPLKIGVEVQIAQDDLEVVKVKIQQCSDNGIADFVRQGSDILSDIATCVNDLLP